MKKSLIALVLASAFGAAHAQSIDMGAFVPSVAQSQPSGAPASVVTPVTSAAPQAKALAPMATDLPVSGNAVSAIAAPDAITTDSPMVNALNAAAGPGVTTQTTLVMPPAHRNSKAVNPFNGKSLNFEETQRELEISKLRTQQLEEQLKQTNLEQELVNVPARKAVEAAQAATATAKETLALRELTAPPPPPTVVQPEPPKKVVAKPKPKPVSKPAPTAQASKPTPRPTLVSVISVGNKRSAVLELDGATLVAADGEITPFGPVRIMDSKTINLGGRTVAVHSATMSRFVESDPKPVDPRERQAGGLPVGATPAALPPAMAGQQAQLPPLQLPPGVNLSSPR